jgi:hypothetical protein
MNTLARFALVAGLALAATATAQERAAVDDGTVRVAALQVEAARVALDASVLDEYAGRYVGADGQAFIVEHDGDALTLDLPASFDSPALSLRAVAAREFVAADATVRISIEVDPAGNVTGVVVRIADEPAVVASKAALRRGVVTIYDDATSGPRGPSTT